MINIIDEGDAMEIEDDHVLLEQARDAATKRKTTELLEKRKKSNFYVGVYKGRLNPLVATWRYPKMNLQQMITIWLMGVPAQHVPPLRLLIPMDVAQFDRQSRKLNIMKNCMLVIKEVAIKNGVWSNVWNGSTVAHLWDGIAADILPHLETVSQKDGRSSTHKSRPFTRAWRTAADKLIDARNRGRL